MALSIEGSRSYVRLNSRTQQRSYQYLANRQLPAAHLWAQYRLLESIRSGCLTDELESHTILARIYGQSDEPLNALEHAILGGSQELVKEFARKHSGLPEFLADMVTSKAPWVRQSALLALEYVGDFAPPELARELVPELLRQLHKDLYDARIAPALLKALETIVLEAADEDIGQLMPVLERFAVREPETYRMTDPGVMTLASRLYRFRPDFSNRPHQYSERWPSGLILTSGRARSKSVETTRANLSKPSSELLSERISTSLTPCPTCEI